MHGQIQSLNQTFDSIKRQVDRLNQLPESGPCENTAPSSELPPQVESAFDDIERFVTGPDLDNQHSLSSVPRARKRQSAREDDPHETLAFSFVADWFHPTRRKTALLSFGVWYIAISGDRTCVGRHVIYSSFLVRPVSRLIFPFTTPQNAHQSTKHRL